MCEVEQAGALPQSLFGSSSLGYFLLQLFVSFSEVPRPLGDFDLQFFTRLPKVCLNLAPHHAKPNQ
jgi:hypothetical protein